MGLFIVLMDAESAAPGRCFADDFVPVSTYDISACAAAAVDYQRRNRHIDGIISIGCDVPHTVATTASILGLPGIPPELAFLTMDKLELKQLLRKKGIPVPWFTAVSGLSDLRCVIQERGPPLVLKPVDSRGARGVLWLRDGVDLAWAYEQSRAFSPSGRVMVEEYLPGPQVSTESIVSAGTTYTPGFSDRNYSRLEEYAPFMIEDGGELPSSLPDGEQRAVRRLVESAIRALGVDAWTVKGDIAFSHGQPYIIELALRLSGGYLCTHEIPLNTGIDFVAAAVTIALGKTPDPKDLQPVFEQFVCQRYLFPKPGRVISIRGIEEIRRKPGVKMCDIRARVGQRIELVTSHPARAGVVIATGESRAEARAAAEDAVEGIHIETVPV